MFISVRAALLAGALLATGLTVNAEPIALSDALKSATESSPRLAQAKGGLINALLSARGAGSPVNFNVWLMPEDDRSPST
jgi:hypothetical protein